MAPVAILTDPNAVAPGQASTVTAHSYTGDVGPTPYYLQVFDHTTGQLLAQCGSGTDCSTSVTMSAPTTHYYTAYIAGYCSACTEPPPSVQASITPKFVTWLMASLSANRPTAVSVGESVTLTATTNAPDKQTSIGLAIIDTSTGTTIASCETGPQLGNSNCSITVSQGAPGTHAYQARARNPADASTIAQTQVGSNTFAETWLSVSVTAAPYVGVGKDVTVIGQANVDVGPTPYYIAVYDVTGGNFQLVVSCGHGTTCSVNAMFSTAQIHTYRAYVGSVPATTAPPVTVKATSADAQVTWASVSLDSDLSRVAPGSTVQVTATASFNVGPTPLYIYIYLYGGTGDHMHPIGGCGSGTSCTVTAPAQQRSTQQYVAYIANSSTGPPSGVITVSDLRSVTTGISCGATMHNIVYADGKTGDADGAMVDGVRTSIAVPSFNTTDLYGEQTTAGDIAIIASGHFVQFGWRLGATSQLGPNSVPSSFAGEDSPGDTNNEHLTDTGATSAGYHSFQLLRDPTSQRYVATLDGNQVWTSGYNASHQVWAVGGLPRVLGEANFNCPDMYSAASTSSATGSLQYHDGAGWHDWTTHMLNQATDPGQPMECWSDGQYGVGTTRVLDPATALIQAPAPAGTTACYQH
jgi:hypothetical protein